MGIYIDSPDAYTLYKKISASKWFVDKTEMLAELSDKTETIYIRCLAKRLETDLTVKTKLLSYRIPSMRKS